MFCSEVLRKFHGSRILPKTSVSIRDCCYGYVKFSLFSSSKQVGILHDVKINYYYLIPFGYNEPFKRENTVKLCLFQSIPCVVNM